MSRSEHQNGDNVVLEPASDGTRQHPGTQVHGICHPRFERVRECFKANFRERDELGASVALIVDGEPVVDLWGGIADPETSSAWDKDTVGVVFSCTKAAVALCIHVLAARSVLSLDDPVAKFWPAFAAHGKGEATVRMALDHSIGLPAFREPMKSDCLLDPMYMAERIAAEAPFWKPGTRVGYHALTFGFLLGELIRLTTGRTLGAFFREEIAMPLGLDFFIGAPEEVDARAARITLFKPSRADAPTPFTQAVMQRGSIANLMRFNSGDWAATGVNTRRGRASENGSGGGITNARSLARMYDAMLRPGSPLGLDPAQIASFAQASSATHCDETLLSPLRFSAGFMLAMDSRRNGSSDALLLIGPQAFGHVGAGGSVGFADPAKGIAFAYTMNRQGAGFLLNDRGQPLVDAVYQCLGARSNSEGFWQ